MKSFSSWKASRDKLQSLKHCKIWSDLSVLLWRQESFIWGVETRFYALNLRFFKTKLTDYLLIPTCKAIFLIKKWAPGLSSYEQISDSQSLAIYSVVALTGRPLPFRCWPDPAVSWILLTRSYTAILEQLKVECSFQILLVFHTFSRKSFFMTAICSFVEIIFSNYDRDRKNCQYWKGSYGTVYFLLFLLLYGCFGSRSHKCYFLSSAVL